jgi:hypothetical protein
MSTPPLTAAARVLAAESAVEVLVPTLAATGATIGVWYVNGRIRVDGGLTPLEVSAMLLALSCTVGWFVGRQTYLLGRRTPWSALIGGAAAAAMVLFGISRLTEPGLANSCAALTGMLESTPDGVICRVGSADNQYLPGTIYRATWSGAISAWGWIALTAAAGLAGLGLRDRRVLPTYLSLAIRDRVSLAPAPGQAGVMGKIAKGGGVQACANPTLWGEICGQLYAAERTFTTGERCKRCQQPFHACDRTVTVRIVSLFSADVDVLNSLERYDQASWKVEKGRAADARPSGQERWAVLGEMTFPEIATIAQVLALVHERLPDWQSSDEVVQQANALAQSRASQIHAWIWLGNAAARLTWARPTATARLATGPGRLRDYGLAPGEDVWLQLDIGLLPLEIRQRARRSPLDGSPDVVENVLSNMWIPVGPVQPSGEPRRVWVPRIEGKALRAWLGTDRRVAPGVRGVATPLPYARSVETATDVLSGPLDFVRYRLPADVDLRVNSTSGDGSGAWPARLPGASISEWDWFDAEQVELLRNESLVQELA